MSKSASDVGNWSAALDQVPWTFVLQTPTHHDGQLVVHSLSDTEPVDLILKQCCQSTIVLAGAGDKARRRIEHTLQSVGYVLR